jgi:hypothetical protein
MAKKDTREIQQEIAWVISNACNGGGEEIIYQ